MKKAVKILICIMMVFMMEPLLCYAAGTWYSTSFSGANTNSAVSGTFESKGGNITCSYSITPSTKYLVSDAKFILQSYYNGTWHDEDTKTVGVSYPSTGGTVFWNKYRYYGTYRVKFSCYKPVTSISGKIQYFRESE